jgi:hypothetical protein
MAIGRGILLALPVVAVFTVFLAAADLIFADYVESVLRWLNLERILEILQARRSGAEHAVPAGGDRGGAAPEGRSAAPRKPSPLSNRSSGSPRRP